MIVEKYIGCSGYYYNHWRKIFYPEGLPKNKWLPFYAEHFNTVEINSSFYHIPLDSSIKNWYKITPADFIFTLKGFRFITHLKKLHVDDALKETLADFQQKAYLLKEKLGCVLWQLPKSVTVNHEKLDAFCKLLHKDIPHVFEFREKSWFTETTYEILRHHHAALCMLSAPGNLPETVLATSDVAYLRFHGKDGWYNDNYSHEELDQWKEKLKPLQIKKLFAYFNNDFNGFAVENGRYFDVIIKDL